MSKVTDRGTLFVNDSLHYLFHEVWNGEFGKCINSGELLLRKTRTLFSGSLASWSTNYLQVILIVVETQI